MALDLKRGDAITLRSEVEAPFRSVRLFFFGTACISATIGFLVSLSQLAGSLGGARGAMELTDVLTNLGINGGTFAVCGYLVRGDLQARDKQIARMTREEKLGALAIELANGKMISIADLRSNARVVIVAGTREHVASALEAAAPFKADLKLRGVLVVPLVLDGTSAGDNGSSEGDKLPPVPREDMRWQASPVRREAWASWFNEQLKFSTKSAENGLFVGLRMDGRVRSSGVGMPPWRRYALELAPIEGEDAWQGFMSGFDGRV